MKTSRVVWGLLAAGLGAGALSLVGCEKSGDGGNGKESRPDASGVWFVTSGSYQRTMDVTQSGGAISGKVMEAGKGEAPVSGSISGASVSLDSGDVHGTGVLEGDAMHGEYRRDDGRRGSWSAARQQPPAS